MRCKHVCKIENFANENAIKNKKFGGGEKKIQS